MSWSFPIGHVFGITVRVHVLLAMMAVGLYCRVAFATEFPPGTAVDTLLLLGLLFVSLLLHEFGHCFGARLADGEAQQIVLWPLGGLAYVDVPHNARSNFVATVMGPFVNLLLALASGLVLAWFYLWPPANPIGWDVFKTPLYSWMVNTDLSNPKYLADTTTALEPWQVLAARFFFINWALFLLNVCILAFPLDGGRLTQEVLWPRMGYRRAKTAAVYIGFAFGILLGVVAIAVNESLLWVLVIAIFVACWQQYYYLETGGEDAVFGYDFSQGYTSLERDQPPPRRRRRRPNVLQRWLERRALLKLQREKEQQEADERRMDQLLDKIQRQGRQSLTDEENRFLKRMAENKYRNRQ